MGMLGYIAGGLAQGLGAGMAKQAEMDWQQRREIALENLRSQNNRAEALNTADLNDRNASRQVERTTNADIQKAGVEAQITANRDKQQFQNQVTLEKIRFDNDKEMTGLRSALARANDESSMRLKRELETGDVTDVLKGSDGFYWTIDKSGRQSRTSIGVPPEASAGSGSILEKLAPPQPTAAPAAAAPKPKAQPAPAKGGKTYTAQDAAATAKRYNISVDEVHRQMRQNGYKLTS